MEAESCTQRFTIGHDSGSSSAEEGHEIECQDLQEWAGSAHAAIPYDDRLPRNAADAIGEAAVHPSGLHRVVGDTFGEPITPPEPAAATKAWTSCTRI